MLQLGHILGLNELTQKSKKTIKVNLVVANKDLVKYYQEHFDKKQKQADPRILFEWFSMDAFQKQLLECPSLFVKDILIVDEGDTMLIRRINQQLSLSYPRHLILLSAVPRDAWTGTQELCFTTIKGREGRYIDASSVFPNRRNEEGEEPELLPEDPEAIVKLAVKKAKEQPVLFYGKSSVYENCPSWPKNQLVIPVSLQLSLNASKFFEELLDAEEGLYFLDADDQKDLHLTRGVDYRSTHPNGICLMLAATFDTKSEYLQALGRVRRSTDAG